MTHSLEFGWTLAATYAYTPLLIDDTYFDSLEEFVWQSSES